MSHQKKVKSAVEIRVWDNGKPLFKLLPVTDSFRPQYHAENVQRGVCDSYETIDFEEGTRTAYNETGAETNLVLLGIDVYLVTWKILSSPDNLDSLSYILLSSNRNKRCYLSSFDSLRLSGCSFYNRDKTSVNPFSKLNSTASGRYLLSRLVISFPFLPPVHAVL
ncbi:hypothetical protein GWK47_010274 [Chionoecetes opilio]|uniref:Uncharacterized protein n=1 Tax=Chionoecetes opilio TaxID=41210 RepID=A0A8J4Y4N5_CHIOP|nr:hypothetical protein GWK47_010274 [Chionoecetes opilio]